MLTGDPIEGRCNLCGGRRLVRRGRQAICPDCRSDARTRLMWLMLERAGLPGPGARVLHLAPEAALAARLSALVGEGYEPADYDPAGFPHVPNVRRLDLIAEAATLPTGRYDLIVHSHVMEHLRGNVTAVLFHLHRALAAGGRQLCSIPVSRDAGYAEDLGSLSDGEATARFGQSDHVRRFGAIDIQRTLGMIFRLPAEYALSRWFDETTLDACAIHPAIRAGWSPSSVLLLEKDDLLLAG